MWPFKNKPSLVVAFEDLVKKHKFEQAMHLLVEIKEQNLLKPEEIEEYANLCVDGYSLNLHDNFSKLLTEKKFIESKQYSDLFVRHFTDNLKIFGIDQDLFKIFNNEMQNEFEGQGTVSVKELGNIRKKLLVLVEKIFKEEKPVVSMKTYVDAVMNSIACKAPS